MEDRFKELERRAAAQEIDTRGWMREIALIAMELPPGEWAYGFIRRHFGGEQPTDEQCGLFTEWLASGFREKEKERAMRRYFMERLPAEPDAATGAEYRRCAAESWPEIARKLGIDLRYRG